MVVVYSFYQVVAVDGVGKTHYYYPASNSVSGSFRDNVSQGKVYKTVGDAKGGARHAFTIIHRNVYNLSTGRYEPRVLPGYENWRIQILKYEATQTDIIHYPIQE